MLLFFVLLIYAFLWWFDCWVLWKNGEKKVFAINVCLFLISLSIASLLALDVKIPSPARPISNIIEKLFGGT